MERRNDAIDGEAASGEAGSDESPVPFAGGASSKSIRETGAISDERVRRKGAMRPCHAGVAVAMAPRVDPDLDSIWNQMTRMTRGRPCSFRLTCKTSLWSDLERSVRFVLFDQCNFGRGNPLAGLVNSVKLS